MKQLILVTINFPIGKITQPLTRWAKDYDLPVVLVYRRYFAGVKPEDLIEPTQNDITNEDDFKQLWHGKWKYNPFIKRKIKKYKDNQRWVYVGNGSQT